MKSLFVHLHLSCAMPLGGGDRSQDFGHVVPHYIAKSQTGTAFLNVLNSLFPNQKATMVHLDFFFFLAIFTINYYYFLP